MSAMNRGYAKIIEFIHFASDIALLNLSYVIVFAIKLPPEMHLWSTDHYMTLLGFMNASWICIAIVVKMYDVPRFVNMENLWKRLIKFIFVHFLLTVAFIFSLKGYYYSRTFVADTYLLFTFLLLLWRTSLLYFFRRIRKMGYNYRKVIIVGGGTTGSQLYNYFCSDLSLGYRFEGFFDKNPEQVLYRDLVKGTIDDVNQYVISHAVDEIFCTLPLTETSQIRRLMSLADNNLIRFKMVLDFRGFLNRKMALDFYYDTPVLSPRSEPLESYFNSWTKRFFDIVFSLLIVVFLLPVLYIVVGLAIKLTSRGPIIFSQKRSGRNNTIFHCYKFRSMSLNGDADKKQAVKEDPRITPVGRFLRKTNLDEMPQFINVLMGHMSVVGPRPHMLSHTKEYTQLVDKFLVRHFVKPGITGWAQVNGFRGPTADERLMYKRVRMDVWYIENWSFLLDIKIILLTVFNMIRGEKNVYCLVLLVVNLGAATL
jgi:putative colanic acid biosynthesis UDP-glucose lipid carrier transferase